MNERRVKNESERRNATGSDGNIPLTHMNADLGVTLRQLFIIPTLAFVCFLPRLWMTIFRPAPVGYLATNHCKKSLSLRAFYLAQCLVWLE